MQGYSGALMWQLWQRVPVNLLLDVCKRLNVHTGSITWSIQHLCMLAAANLCLHEQNPVNDAIFNNGCTYMCP
jgi:hypothetical protein